MRSADHFAHISWASLNQPRVSCRASWIPAKAKTLPIEKIGIDKATFDRMHAEDKMATDKLKEGIEGFSAALVKLEQLLAKRLAELESRTPTAV